MLARERSPGVDADLEDLCSELLGLLGFALDAPIVEDEWMEVAVARVEHVADAKAVLHGELVDPAKHLR
jgi:hypothetical protein